MQFTFQSMSISAAEPFAKNAAEMESISPFLQHVSWSNGIKLKGFIWFQVHLRHVHEIVKQGIHSFQTLRISAKHGKNWRL